jgi:arylsulfatase A-like enzyme
MKAFRLLLVSCIAYGVTGAVAAERPNIVFILSDDLGYGDIQAYNPDSKIPTPHLDRMAAEGMRFTDAHAGGSTCKPSRYALFSGEFAVRMLDKSDKKGPLLPKGQPTIASLLRYNGYRTAMVGKWHLGFDQNGEKGNELLNGFSFDPENMTGGPVDRGFESYFGMHASLDIPPYFYIDKRTATELPSSVVEASDSVGTEENWNHIQGAFWRAGGIGSDFKHLEVTPRFCEEACEVIENHDGEKPLFLYLALPSPHTPWVPIEEYQGRSGAGMYGDFVMQVDAVVGRVMASLKAVGMDENTLLLFSSDNGPVWYAENTEMFSHAATGPLRGIKGSAWEGGHRMPFLARWPARLSGGLVTNHTVAFCDVFATFAALVGQEPLPDGVARDSVSFAGLLLRPEEKLPSRPPILHDSETIRAGDWKLLMSKKGRGFGASKGVKYSPELYHLKEDLSERNNLYREHPEVVEEIRALLESYQTEMPKAAPAPKNPKARVKH